MLPRVRCVLILALLAGACAAPVDDTRDVAVFLVRHAEKAQDDPRDPDLSEPGRERARLLAQMLSEAGVTHLFSTEFRRTRQTLGPLAQVTGIPVTVMPAGDSAAWLEALRDLEPGATAVVAGHSNTIPGLACDLGGAAPGLDCDARRLPDDRYDRMFVVLLARSGPSRTLTLRYGAEAAR